MLRIVVLTVFISFSVCFSGVFGMAVCRFCDTTFDFNPTACVDPVTSTGISMCQHAIGCSSVMFEARNKSMVMRDCAPRSNPCGTLEEQYTRWYPDISNFQCYNCTGDYCNDAPFNSTETIERVKLLDVQLD